MNPSALQPKIHSRMSDFLRTFTESLLSSKDSCRLSVIGRQLRKAYNYLYTLVGEVRNLASGDEEGRG